MKLIQENKPAIIFLLVFMGLYVSLNTIYGFIVEAYYPQADPITLVVSKHVTWFLSFFDHTIDYSVTTGSRFVSINKSGQLVISVFEGCNGINVMIVFISFLVAFHGKLKQTVLFGALGLVVIYLMNFSRVSLLYGVELYYPRYLYFFHKYLFTGVIYAGVFLMWFVWAKWVRSESSK
ncbi:MAG: exosortase family protein XrtF [Cyclobacteriaceae bacterium]|nr:exosortase family protein XrtF [Cyclobacteriaceae bacterium]